MTADLRVSVYLNAVTCRESWSGGEAEILHLPYMLSQNRARVLGFSWLRRCLNQRCMVLTSQSSCLDSPSNLFSSGCFSAQGPKDQVSSSLKTRVKNKDKACTTLVIAVKTFSRIALDCAFCGPLAWIFRPFAHGLAMNLQWKDPKSLLGPHDTEKRLHQCQIRTNGVKL